MIPIVLVPGLLCTAEVFAAQIAALWPYGAVTVASTLEGDTIPEIAAAILETAPPRFALAGISMGGYIVFEMLRQAPERVVKVALIDTSARPDTPEQTAKRRALIAEVGKAADFARPLAFAFAGYIHPSRRRDRTLNEINLRMARVVGYAGFVRQTEAIIARPDSRPGLEAIAVPTLVVVGDFDPLTPPERAREIADAIPGARLVVIPECGHSSTTERPEAVSAALIEWIAGDTTGAP